MRHLLYLPLLPLLTGCSYDAPDPKPDPVGVVSAGATSTKPSPLPLRTIQQPFVDHRNQGLFTQAGYYPLRMVQMQCCFETDTDMVWLTNTPDGAELREVEFIWEGPSYAEVPPPRPFGFELRAAGRYGQHVSLGVAEDSSQTAAQYEVPHPVTLSLQHTIDLSEYRYAVEFWGDAGEGGQPGGLVLSLALKVEP